MERTVRCEDCRMGSEMCRVPVTNGFQRKRDEELWSANGGKVAAYQEMRQRMDEARREITDYEGNI